MRLRPRTGYPSRGAIPVTTWLRSSASASARQRREPEGEGLLPRRQHVLRQRERPAGGRAHAVEGGGDGHPGAAVGAQRPVKIGRASCRERVELAVVAEAREKQRRN